MQVTKLNAQAEQLAGLLRQRNLRIVFAESCTGGLVCSSLTRIPDISACLCGSAVVYRIGTKECWLGIPPEDLARYGAVSLQIATQMATRVLEKTPEADLASAITGHLGPHDPPEQDGLLYVAVAQRVDAGQHIDVSVKEHWLPKPPQQEDDSEFALVRISRQQMAATFLLDTVCQYLQE